MSLYCQLIICFSYFIISFVDCFPVLQPNITNLVDFRYGPELLPTYGTLSDKAYGIPDKETGERVALWNPYTHKMNPEELGVYEKGDILIPREPPLEVIRNGLVSPASRWPAGYIPYIIDGYFTDEELNTIYSAMHVLHVLTCINFVPWEGEEDYLSIENSDTGCWSAVGRIGGKQIINLQTPACVWGVGTPLHEFMHTLGFYHEQSRHDRDKYVQIFWKNILIGQDYNFKKFPPSVAISQVPYDFNSVMHYSGVAFSKNERQTMKPKLKGVSLGQRDFLSEKDIEKIRLMYKCHGKISYVESNK